MHGGVLKGDDTPYFLRKPPFSMGFTAEDVEVDIHFPDGYFEDIIAAYEHFRTKILEVEGSSKAAESAHRSKLLEGEVVYVVASTRLTECAVKDKAKRAAWRGCLPFLDSQLAFKYKFQNSKESQPPNAENGSIQCRAISVDIPEETSLKILYTRKLQTSSQGISTGAEDQEYCIFCFTVIGTFNENISSIEYELSIYASNGVKSPFSGNLQRNYKGTGRLGDDGKIYSSSVNSPLREDTIPRMIDDFSFINSLASPTFPLIPYSSTLTSRPPLPSIAPQTSGDSSVGGSNNAPTIFFHHGRTQLDLLSISHHEEKALDEASTVEKILAKDALVGREEGESICDMVMSYQEAKTMELNQNRSEILNEAILNRLQTFSSSHTHAHLPKQLLYKETFKWKTGYPLVLSSVYYTGNFLYFQLNNTADIALRISNIELRDFHPWHAENDEIVLQPDEVVGLAFVAYSSSRLNPLIGAETPANSAELSKPEELSKGVAEDAVDTLLPVNANRHAHMADSDIEITLNWSFFTEAKSRFVLAQFTINYGELDSNKRKSILEVRVYAIRRNPFNSSTFTVSYSLSNYSNALFELEILLSRNVWEMLEMLPETLWFPALPLSSSKDSIKTAIPVQKSVYVGRVSPAEAVNFSIDYSVFDDDADKESMDIKGKEILEDIPDFLARDIISDKFYLLSTSLEGCKLKSNLI